MRTGDLSLREIEGIKRYYKLGKTAKEACMNIDRPLGTIQWYYLRFKLEGVTKTSDTAQALLTNKGTLGLNLKSGAFCT